MPDACAGGAEDQRDRGLMECRSARARGGDPAGNGAGCERGPETMAAKGRKRTIGTTFCDFPKSLRVRYLPINSCCAGRSTPATSWHRRPRRDTRGTVLPLPSPHRRLPVAAVHPRPDRVRTRRSRAPTSAAGEGNRRSAWKTGINSLLDNELTRHAIKSASRMCIAPFHRCNATMPPPDARASIHPGDRVRQVTGGAKQARASVGKRGQGLKSAGGAGRTGSLTGTAGSPASRCRS